MIFANSVPKKPRSTLHASWEGETIESLWNKNFSWVDRSQSARTSFGDLVTLIRIRPHLFDIFATTAWSLWCRRNKVHLNETAQPLERIAEEACQYLKTYRNAHWRPPKGPRRAKIKWHPLQNQLWWGCFWGFWRSRYWGGGSEFQRWGNGFPIPNIANLASVETVKLLTARRAVMFVREVGLIYINI